MFAHANIQSQIGLKQFVIMATGCTTSSQCKICNIVKNIYDWHRQHKFVY